MEIRSISRIGRVVLVLVAVGGLILAATEGRHRLHQRQALVDLAAETGLAERQPEATAAILRDVDPYWSRLRLARALVLEAMDPTSLGELTPREAALEVARAPQRLAEARRLVERAASQRPVVWQAWLFRGAATYMEWFRSLDERLFTQREAWEAPLDQAIALAPDRVEPRRVVAGIAIDLWPTHDAETRERATEQVRGAFEHLPTLQRFAVAWLTVAEQPFDVIPEDAESWDAVCEAARRLGDWPLYCDARTRWDGVRRQEAPTFLSRAEWLVRHGERRMARRELIDFIRATPPGFEWADEVEQAIRILPPGIAGRETDRAFGPWLEWGLEAAARRLELLTPEALARLAAGMAGLPDPDRATVALLSGRPEEAERISRRHEDLNTERWARFGLVHTRRLLETGDRAGAARAWALVHPEVRNAPHARDVRSRFEVGLANEAAVIEPRGLRPATSWRWRGNQAFTDLPPSGGATRVRIAWDVAPGSGAVVEVSVDFRSVWRGEVRVGENTDFIVPGDDNPVHLRVRPLAGGRPVPGLIQWWPEGEPPPEDPA